MRVGEIWQNTDSGEKVRIWHIETYSDDSILVDFVGVDDDNKGYQTSVGFLRDYEKVYNENR